MAGVGVWPIGEMIGVRFGVLCNSIALYLEDTVRQVGILSKLEVFKLKFLSIFQELANIFSIYICGKAIK